MFTNILIDGDVLLYQVCRGVEKDEPFGDIHVVWSDFELAKALFETRVSEIEQVLRVSVGAIMFSDAKNWRKDVLSSYKAHRKDVRKPLVFNRLKEWAQEKYNCVIWPRLEADDTLGLHQREDTIIASIDKDLGTVPGWFAHIRVTGEIEIKHVTESQARYRHMIQAFMGDKVDGYPGCPGIGPKTAEKILDKVVKVSGEIQRDEWLNCWNAVVYQYEKQGLSVDDAMDNFLVSKILHEDYAFKDGVVTVELPTSFRYSL